MGWRTLTGPGAGAVRRRHLCTTPLVTGLLRGHGGARGPRAAGAAQTAGWPLRAPAGQRPAQDLRRAHGLPQGFLTFRSAWRMTLPSAL